MSETDLVGFLRTRLDAAEQAVHEAGEGRVAWLTYRTDEGGMHYTTVASGTEDAASVDHTWIADGKELPKPAHVHVFYDSAQALREIEAKRRIIEEHAPSKTPGVALAERGCRSCITAQKWDDRAAESNCLTLRLLGEAYDGHPDYQERWRP